MPGCWQGNGVGGDRAGGGEPGVQHRERDLFRWSELWPRLAGWFGLEVAPPLRRSLADVMADKEPLWKELSEVPFDAVSSWPFADFVFGWDYDFFADSSKIRRAGFHEYVDTPEMFFGIFAELRERHVIP